jgi:fructokinase
LPLVIPSGKQAVFYEMDAQSETRKRIMQKPLVVGLGEVLWDLLPSGRQLGGAPANFAFHAQSLGADARVVSCVGADPLGDGILQHLNDLGLSTENVVVDLVNPTGTVSVELDSDGTPSYVIHKNVAWDFLPLRPKMLSLASEADAVCFGSLGQRSPIARDTISEFLAATRFDCLRIFDINLRQHFFNFDIIESGLNAAKVLKLNDEELPVIAKMLSIQGSEEEMLMSLCRRYGLQLVALTKGAAGSILFTTEQCSVRKGEPVEVVDAVGAGDAFTAALAMGLLAELDLETIHTRAARIARFVCTQHGATPKLPRELL